MNIIPNSRIILLRHAESVKNIKKIHGGSGEVLTSKGVQQAKAIADQIDKYTRPGHLRIYTSTSNHTRYTAEIIAEKLETKLEPPFDFRPLYLGVADGISEDQLMKQHPDVHILFQKWRRREIDIKKLLVPQMESYMDFWRRGQKIIEHLPNDSDVVLVCSNSLMILLSHYMLGNNPEYTDYYRHFDIQNCGMIVFDTLDYERFRLNDQISTVNLSWVYQGV